MTTLHSDDEIFDVIVVGAGHAGCEAAFAASRMGMKTLLLTMNLDRIAYMSCNPAVGGLGKSHLVKEIDALDGVMALNTDLAGIQFRVLNTRKGPAVRATRVQTDKARYSILMKKRVENQKNLYVRQATVERLLVENRTVKGVETHWHEKIFAKAVILTTGTFLGGLIHIGLVHFPGGRMGDSASIGLSEHLRSLGFKMGRLKTGTCPRIDGRTIDFSQMEIQLSDDPPKPFSYMTKKIENPLLPCYLTYTNERTHEIIRSGLDRSPLYTGKIKGIGVRYCPSIEDKVVRFSDKDRHRIFLEPEGLDTNEYYPNGLSTSLPLDVQIKMLRTIPGLEYVKITRPGYAIEYDFSDPTQLYPWLETKIIQNLFFAGQINGTTGYEEAAAQGIVAGINAALKIRGEDPFILRRDEAYIGVLIDDLVTKGTDEPYRMFTSRAEFRLVLREDNADLRLTEKGYKIGVVGEERLRIVEKKRREIEEVKKIMKDVVFRPDGYSREIFQKYKIEVPEKPSTLEELLKKPEITIDVLKELHFLLKNFHEDVLTNVELDIKYDGYMKRQKEMIEKMKRLEEKRIPSHIDYSVIPGLSREVVEKLTKFKPLTLGQASRIPGVSPSSIVAIMVYLKKAGII